MAFTVKKKNPLEDSNVKLAAENVASLEASQPADWTGGTYGQAVKDALDKINNREKFTYNLNADMLYNQYKDQHINAGKMAMADTMGQAAALTGGYGNSYAATAGNQAYQSYLQQLNNKVPELYQLAYNKYAQEGQDLENALTRYQNLYNTEYAENRNALSDWQNKLNRADSLYQAALNLAANEANTEYNNAFNLYQQQVAEEQWNKQFAESQRQYNESLKRSGSGGGSSYSGSSGGASNIINTKGAVLDKSAAGAGNLKANGVTVTKLANGKTRYTDTVTGKSSDFAAGVNPFTGTMSNDAKTNGKYDSSKTFSNGYQPNNVKGDKLKSYATLASGQNVWQAKSSGKYYVWDGANNKYVQVKKVNGTWKEVK